MSLGLRILQLTSFIRSMMKVIEGHFNPLRRPDRSIYSCRLTERKVQLDSDEREKIEGKIERTRQTRPGWSLLLSHTQSHLEESQRG